MPTSPTMRELEMESRHRLENEVERLRAENERLKTALNTSYGALDGRGIPGLLERAAEVLKHYAGERSRSILAENLHDAASRLCSALGLFCADCGKPRPLLTLTDEQRDVCSECAHRRWRRSA